MKTSKSQIESDHIKEIKMNKQKAISEELKESILTEILLHTFINGITTRSGHVIPTDMKMCGITSKQGE